MLVFRDNLATRLAAILLGGLALLAAAAAAVFLWPVPGRPGGALWDLPAPREAAAVVGAIEAASPQARPLVLEALNDSVTAVSLARDFPPPAPELRRAPELEWLFARYSGVLEGRPFRVEQRRRLVLSLLGGAGAEPSVRMVVALRTGGVLVIERRPSAFLRAFLARGAALLAATAMVLLAALYAAVRQAARPVQRLAEAAQRFSIDAARQDLPVGGPRELRALAVAFNGLQARVRGLVQARTGALAAVAHDLRTYMTRLRLRCEFIAEPQQRARAERDLEEMSQLLDDILLFARESGGGAAARNDRCDAGTELADFVRGRAEQAEPVRLAAAPGEGEFTLGCGRLALRRMLANLTDNAVRYGGATELSACVEGRMLAIEVRDHGEGVPAEALARLTQPFERLEGSRGRATGGAGLGLAIVDVLAQSCGGALSLSNAPGGGLSARLRLPAA
jgi:signal transduction histidine kinase